MEKFQLKGGFWVSRLDPIDAVGPERPGLPAWLLGTHLGPHEQAAAPHHHQHLTSQSLPSKSWILGIWFFFKNLIVNIRMSLDPDFSPDEQEEKARLISQVILFAKASLSLSQSHQENILLTACNVLARTSFYVIPQRDIIFDTCKRSNEKKNCYGSVKIMKMSK